VAVIGLVYVPYIARPLRGQVLEPREQRFVEAARASGLGPVRVMVSEMLPHLWATILVLAPILFAMRWCWSPRSPSSEPECNPPSRHSGP
jgi:ABC-type dipeptide/oligopeptide/nickel transport system permease subunit